MHRVLYPRTASIPSIGVCQIERSFKFQQVINEPSRADLVLNALKEERMLADLAKLHELIA